MAKSITLHWTTQVTEKHSVVLEGEDIPDLIGSALEAGYDLDLDLAVIGNVYRGISSDEVQRIRDHITDLIADYEETSTQQDVQVTERELTKIETVR